MDLWGLRVQMAMIRHFHGRDLSGRLDFLDMTGMLVQHLWLQVQQVRLELLDQKERLGQWEYLGQQDGRGTLEARVLQVSEEIQGGRDIPGQLDTQEQKAKQVMGTCLLDL